MKNKMNNKEYKVVQKLLLGTQKERDVYINTYIKKWEKGINDEENIYYRKVIDEIRGYRK